MHYGLTSSDVVDTALALQMTRARSTHPRGRARARVGDRQARAREFRDTPMVGRTHGIHAEPTTFGAKLALWAMQVRRDRERLRAGPRRTIAVGKLSGAVGTYSNVDPARRAVRLRAPRAAAGARDAGARRATATPKCCTRARRSARRIESFALEIRHLQRTEVREAEEPFREGEQKGSSAMPHKRNPMKSEQLSGLARVLRGNLQAALEDVALWHERDISHSSVERIIIPDSLMLAYYMTRADARSSSQGLRVYPERMLRNLDASFGLVFSQPVLLALVESGREPRRRVPHRAAQRDARVAGGAAVPRAARATTPTSPPCSMTRRLDACFDLKRALANVGRVFDALDDGVDAELDVA